jgi:hypothetical protein
MDVFSGALNINSLKQLLITLVLVVSVMGWLGAKKRVLLKRLEKSVEMLKKKKRAWPNSQALLHKSRLTPVEP